MCRLSPAPGRSGCFSGDRRGRGPGGRGAHLVRDRASSNDAADRTPPRRSMAPWRCMRVVPCRPAATRRSRRSEIEPSPRTGGLPRGGRTPARSPPVPHDRDPAGPERQDAAPNHGDAQAIQLTLETSLAPRRVRSRRRVVGRTRAAVATLGFDTVARLTKVASHDPQRGLARRRPKKSERVDPESRESPVSEGWDIEARPRSRPPGGAWAGPRASFFWAPDL